MKYMKLYEQFEDIDAICKKYWIRNYTINSDVSVSVDDSVSLSFRGLTKLPIKFKEVSGHFWCFNNNLTSLEGCPERVGGHFNCNWNRLTSLEGFRRSH